jgi:hypothetical protein
MVETRNEQQRSDTRSLVAGFVILAAIVYFAVVFWQIPDENRWLVTAGVAVVVGLLAFAAIFFDRLRPFLLKFGLRAYDSLLFVLVVVVVVVVPITLDRPERIVLLKAAAIVYFSLLPALLYLQFTSRKTLAVWLDFVSNLYKLDADAPGNLPRPSSLSPFYERWRAARDRAWGKGWVHKRRGESREQADERLDEENPYGIKFRDLFGTVPDAAEAKKTNAFSVRSTHKLQVVVATALVAVGWAFVLQPEGVFALEISRSVELTGLPEDPPTGAFAFGFLGAYFYILQMLVRRYFQNDLKSTAYINATMRLVIVTLLVWAVIPVLDEHTDVSPPMLLAIAFVIGVFPSVGWQFLQALVRKPLGRAVDTLEPKHKLGDLDGLNVWYESRLLEVGIEDMQNLATTDIVDLMLNTRIPVDRIVDWIDQAFLYVRVTDEGERSLLRSYGIRTVTDLDDLLDGAEDVPNVDRLLNLRIDEGNAVDNGLPSRIRAIHTTTHAERNLRHVRAWKHATRPKARRVRAPEKAAEEPPVAAAPQPV